MPPPHHDRTAASAIAALLDPDRIATVLAPWLPDAAERDFVVRCILAEGPIHHRGASFALLALAAQVAERTGIDPHHEDIGIAVPMRLPPHLERPDAPPDYPLRLDPGAVQRIAGGSTAVGRVLADAVTDGPPHHALANVALLNLLAAILRRLEAAR